jgi:hypothetical protein
MDSETAKEFRGQIAMNDEEVRFQVELGPVLGLMIDPLCRKSSIPT